MPAALELRSLTLESALPEVNIGVFPLSATQRLPRVIGVARAAGFMLAGESVAASDPVIAGCFDRIVMSEDELLQAALQLAQACVTAPPVLLRARPIPGDPVAELQSVLERHAGDALSPAQQALLQAVRAAVEADSFQAGLDCAQYLFDDARWYAASFAAGSLSARWNCVNSRSPA